MSIETHDLGDQVFCDDCGDDYTKRDDQGGIMFGTKACCPTCAKRVEQLANKYNETHFIRERCPEGMSFANWVRTSLRGGEPGSISVYSGEDFQAGIDKLRGDTP